VLDRTFVILEIGPPVLTHNTDDEDYLLARCMNRLLPNHESQTKLT